MQTRPRKSAATRKGEIVLAALALAREFGPDRVTTGMIAEQLGLTQPAIYKHFPRKEDIWQAVADALCAEIALNVATAEGSLGEAGNDPLARLRLLVDSHLRLVARTPALPEIMVMRDPKGAYIALRQQLQASMAGFRHALTANVRSAIKSGAIAQGIDAEDAATLIFGIIQSLVLRLLISKDAEAMLRDGKRLMDLQLSVFARTGERF